MRRITLKRSPDGGEQVWFTSKMGNSPIGRIVHGTSGWTYFSYPILRVERGPVRSKAAAIRAVVKDYVVYMGIDLGYAKKYRRRARSYSAKPKKLKRYNATAQVTYEAQGGWKGSFGLRTLYDIMAGSKAAAKKIATEIYESEPDYRDADKKYDNVRLHLSVEEAF